MSQINCEIGIIGGSGVYQIDGIEIIEEITIETPFGKPSDKVVFARLEGTEFLFLARHNRSHTILPHEVNYCANIYALKSLGVKFLISVSAVGSLKEEMPPGTIFFPDQFIDWTKGQRRRSFYGEGIVSHVSVANPIEKTLQELLFNQAQDNKISSFKDGSYICIEGPQFSSFAESNIYRSFGASVIGMTNVPEAYLAKEAAMAYATMALVTDYDCWKQEHCTVEEIMKVMKGNNLAAQKIIKSSLGKINANSVSIDKQNEVGLMSSMEKLDTNQQEILKTLLR